MTRVDMAPRICPKSTVQWSFDLRYFKANDYDERVSYCFFQNVTVSFFCRSVTVFQNVTVSVDSCTYFAHLHFGCDENWSGVSNVSYQGAYGLPVHVAGHLTMMSRERGYCSNMCKLVALSCVLYNANMLDMCICLFVCLFHELSEICELCF